MSLFGPTSSYSQDQKNLSRREIRDLVSRSKIRTLDADEESLVEETIDKARGGNGRISLAQIDLALRGLMNSKKISPSDKKSLMNRFASHLE